MERRTLLKALALAFMARQAHAAPPKTMKDVEALQKDWKNFLPTGAVVPSPTEPVKLSKDEWRKKLPGQSYKVLREESTEMAGTSPLNNEKRAGIFACAGCDLPLFSSETKYESGTGWPSFWKPLDNAIGETKDTTFGMARTEVHCRRCGGHMGHVFDDGPKPTGLRYCIDGFGLVFHPAGPSAS